MSDYDQPLAITQLNRKARKIHKCVECRGAIQPGEIYECVSGIWPEGPARYKTCSDCARIRTADAADDWYYGGLLEDLCNGDDKELLREFASCAQKRGVQLPAWLLERVMAEEEGEK